MGFKLLSKVYKTVQSAVSTDVAAGDYLSSGALQGFALSDIASGDLGTVVVEAEIVAGVKEVGESWVAGDAIYSTSAGVLSKTSSAGNRLIGYAYQEAEVADPEGYITMAGFAEFLV